MNQNQSYSPQDLQDRLWQLFFPYMAQEVDRLRRAGTRFVHYTSAESALKILSSNRMLLRNAILMNDFSEVQYGLTCLSEAYKSDAGKRLQAFLTAIQPDFVEILEATFNETEIDLRAETYLLSISEHGDGEDGDEFEDALGRLSMWRAYAQKDGVAIIFNNAPFLTESNALNAYSSPVNYKTIDGFSRQFAAWVDAIIAEGEFLSTTIGPQGILDNFVRAFRFAVFSTKHPSFREEREWRVIYSPTLVEREGLMTDAQRAKIPSEIMCLGGVPQRIYAIPFKNYPDEGFVSATIPELFDRVLIGPSRDGYAIWQALVSELEVRQLPDASNKVRVTGIPLRQ